MSTFWFWKRIPLFFAAKNLEMIGGHILEILLLYIAARIAIRVGINITRRTLLSRAVRMDERRRKTMTSLMENILRYIVYFVYLLMILPLFNIHIEALLAGAGIAGLAIGFGAQNLIKDILTGLFILFEDQYGVGDSVKINTFSGTVTHIGIRLTYVQAWTGEVEIIPNGQIQTVTNYSKNNSVAVIEVGVSYQTDLNQAIEVTRNVIEQLREEREEIVGDVSVLGVQSLGPYAVNIRAIAECRPNQQTAIQRIAQQRLKEAFDRAGIEIPLSQQFVHIQTTNG